MTSATSRGEDRRFMTVTLPMILGGGGLIVYLVTLNHWMALHSIATVARVSGWLWQPQVGRPLTTLLLYPFRWLPGSWLPITLNIFHAACAALVLALLARSVALLRYDLSLPRGFVKVRSASILLARVAWVPPLLAVLLCGLQLSFWEHATAASGEMLDLLLFAYLVRCLIEFRVDQKQIWLSRATLACGAGMANYWVMVAYLPIFILALVLLKGLTPFLDRRFLLRMALCGLAGLSLYLLLPVAYHLASRGEVQFWPTLKAHLKLQKESVEAWRSPALRLLGLSSLLPFVLISVPWKSHTVQIADDTRFGVFITRATGHFVHAVFFVTSVWMAFDPPFAPRTLVPGPALLTFYYMSALIGGYCCGYFLLFHVRAGRKAIGKAAVAGAWLLIGGVPLLLAARNTRMMLATNGSLLHDFARQIYADLPPGKSVVLVDDWDQGILLRGESRSHRTEKQPIILDAASLSSARYHAWMAALFKDRWPVRVPTNRAEVVRPPRILRLVAAFRGREPVLHLGPAYGYLLEQFTDQPRGFIHALDPRPPTEAASQLLSAPVLSTNEEIWQQRWNANLEKLSHKIAASSDRGDIHLRPHQNSTVNVVGVACSKSLNYWGVQMRRADRLPEAAIWFQRAIELSPNNLAARINLEYTQRCQRGQTARLNPLEIRQQFLIGQNANWREILIRDGPVDEPTFLLRSGRVEEAAGNSRQAAGDFARCLELAPDWTPPKIWLAQSCLDLRNFDSVLELTASIQASNSPESAAQLAQVLRCRGMALMGLGRTNEVTSCIEGFLVKYRSHREVLAAAADLYGDTGHFEQQIAALEELLQREPARASLLAKRGIAELKLSKFETAIATLTKTLSLAPEDTDARLSRAVAYLGADKLEDARSDYEKLVATSRDSPDAAFGLGTIAWRQQNTNAAIAFYQQYLSNALPRSLQYKVASERLAQLKISVK